MPFEFQAGGRTYTLAPLTNRRIREIAAATGTDIRDAVETTGRIAELMLGDQDTALKWVWELVKDQHPGGTFEAFTDDLTGEDVDRVLTRTWEWVADFFRHSPFGRLIRRKGVSGVTQLLTEKAEELAADPARSRTSNATSGNLPESSAATPTSGASAS